VIERAMEKSPENRQPTMAALEAELHPFVLEPDARRRDSGGAKEESSRIEVVKQGEQQVPSVRIMPPKRDRGLGEADTLATGVPPSAPASTAPASASLDPMSTAMREPARPWWKTWVVAIPSVALALLLIARSELKGSTPAAPPLAPSADPAQETVDFSVQSSTAEATVTFRGKTKRLPIHEDVRRGADPELIEITAPGHQGRQLWLVLDEPRRLAFDLPLGSGMLRGSVDDAGNVTTP
jgi:hypothetical protein